MSTKEKPIPKKRGRKPKKKVIVEDTKNKSKITDNLIVKLNKFKEETTVIEPFNNIESNIETSVGDTQENKSEVCWNCCHPFHNLIYGIPVKYIDGIFYIYGDFCSLECCARYSVENYPRNYEIISLINLYSNKMCGVKDRKVEIAPNRLLLKKFGGNLTIEEYRSNFDNNNVHDVKIPPILPINHIVDSYEINNDNYKNNLKLYRKKPLPSEKKSITKSMNLSIN
tara:strand:- start:2517 stop:3194 length:678 start_codon:yes stop_codon:yes gene_type:complete